jgi:hypothetical protein
MALEPDVAENESGKTLNRVQNGLNLQLNSWSPCRVLALFKQLANYSNFGGSAISFTTLEAPAPSMGGGGERRRRPSELQFAPPPVATRNGLARPAHRRARNARKQLKLSRPSLSKTGNVPKITHKKCYRPQIPNRPGQAT